MQQDRRVLADGIQQYRIFRLRDRFADDVDALSLQVIEVARRRGVTDVRVNGEVVVAVDDGGNSVHGLSVAGFRRVIVAARWRSSRGRRAGRIPCSAIAPTTSARRA